MPKLDRFGALPLTPYAGNVDILKLDSESTKYVIYESAASYPAAIIALQNGSNTEDHFNSIAAIAPTIGTVGVYYLSKTELRSLAFLFVEGKLVDESDLIPEYVRHQIDSTGPWDLISSLPHRKIDGVSLVAISVVHDVYGHWLLDILPRIWMAKLLTENLDAINIIIPHGTPQFAITILRDFFGINKSVYHSFAEENLQIEHALIPSLLHNNHYFHPAMNDFVAYLLNHPLVTEARKQSKHNSKLIYVTRQGFRQTSRSYARTIANEDEVFQLMDELGVQIVSPESMKWQDQILLFAGARVIIGESGSGLHNTLFSTAGTAVVCLNPVNQVQSSIAGLRRHTLINQCSPTEKTNSTLLYRVEIERLRMAALAAIHATGETFDRPTRMKKSASNQRRDYNPEGTALRLPSSDTDSSWIHKILTSARQTAMLAKRSIKALFKE
ncbi:glycosyltransferase 61 family protein [Methylobacterium sp. Leaf469]|jgi:capsular polysaccharide biosynthesis protein|uniref:glycosyltransferase family 61 protein n=1 Tax=Methylobacterium sp. Leaf469 TaxID=1736387 RepID=UPI0009E9AAE2|nr:glycosyltransferase 61 family protein [Methylobacterium sp. Leaf469]